MGDPMRPLMWVSKSQEKLCGARPRREPDIRGDTFHPEWNYSVHPRPAK
jgi:hypothetical protein